MTTKAIEVTQQALTGVAMWFTRALLLWACWNCVFPDWLAAVPPITYWRAFGLIGIMNAVAVRNRPSEGTP